MNGADAADGQQRAAAAKFESMRLGHQDALVAAAKIRAGANADHVADATRLKIEALNDIDRLEAFARGLRKALGA